VTLFCAADWHPPSCLLQGDAPDLLLPPVNSYQRLLQYQELRRPQFGAAEAPGFYVEASQCMHMPDTMPHHYLPSLSVLLCAPP
jgi:hypothetical protein